MRHIFLAASLFMIGFAAYAAEKGFFALPPDWRGIPLWQDTAPVQPQATMFKYDGAYAQGLDITFSPRADWKRPFSVSDTLTKEVKLSDFRSLTFKAKMELKGTSEDDIIIQFKGKNLSISTDLKSLIDTSVKCSDGYSAYIWNFDSLSSKIKADSILLEVTIFKKTPVPADSVIKLSLFDMILNRKESAPVPVSVEPPKWTQTSEKTEAKKIPLDGWVPEIAEAADGVTIEKTTVSLGGKKLQALRLTYVKAKKFTPVSLGFSFNAEDYNVMTFKAKVETPEGAKRLNDIEAPMTGWYSYQFNAWFDNFGVALEDANTSLKWCKLGIPTTHFLQHIDKTQKTEDGFKTFKWDIVNENQTGNKGFDRENVNSIKFFYDNKKIPEGAKVVITIVEPTLIKGLKVAAGDQKRYKEFKQYIDSYQPDYSDSSKYLGAPEKGRLTEPLPLVKNGKALGEIVGISSVWNAEGNAVNELYSWLFRLTGGVEIPIVKAPGAEDNVKIFIGSKNAEKLFPEDLAALKGSDGCAIRTKDKSVYIFGATQKGTLNGVYTFLEGNTDIIWPRPSELFGAVYTENPGMSIVWGDYLHRAPARNWGWMGKTSGPQFDYQVRNRCNYFGLRSDVSFKYWGLFMEEGGGHNLHSWIPWSLWKTNPEYWCMIDGKRQHPNAYKNQICLTNPKGREIFIDRWLHVIERSPQMKASNCLNIKPEDNWGSCECEECLRPIRLPDGSLLEKDDISFRSTQFFMFLNVVASAAHNNGYPNMQIGTYVYFFTVQVPKIPVTSYLRPYFCDYVRKDQKVPIFAPVNEIWWRILNEWTKISDRVVIREYTGLEVYFRPLAEVVAYDIRAELSAGALEFTSESLPECSSASQNAFNQQMDVAFMEYWMIARLYWEPDADVEQLRKYFMRRTFREAAPDMEKFYGTIRQLYFKEKRTIEFEENHETLRLIIAKGKDGELRGYLDNALKNVRHPLSEKMIRLISGRYDTWIGELKKEKK